MRLAAIQCSDTFLQGQERLIDLGSVDPCLFALVDSVSSSLTPCQINKANFPKSLFAFEKTDLHDCMGSWTIGISTVLRGYADCTSLLNDLHKIVYIHDFLLGQTDNVDILFAVLTSLQHLSIIQKIKQLATVNLIERHRDV